jgi:cobalt-zinc-cadmium efflux system protein
MPHDQHGHSHAHHHVDPEAGDRRVALAIGVNVGLTVAQVVAGMLSGSLALIADAIHNLSDAVSLGIAWIARRIARRPPDARMTFGYGRAELVAALVNYTTLVVVALWLGWEGVQRLFDPQPVEGWIVVWVAAIALVIDTVTALLLAGMRSGSANIRAAFLHNVADALGSLAVIFSGVVILLYDWRLVDPAVTLAISGYILWHAAQGIGPVIRILMQGAPPEPHAQDVLDAMESEHHVDEVHHLHLWQIDEWAIALEAHVVVSSDRERDRVRERLRAMLSERFGIEHSTVEMETEATRCVAPSTIGH